MDKNKYFIPWKYAILEKKFWVFRPWIREILLVPVKKLRKLRKKSFLIVKKKYKTHELNHTRHTKTKFKFKLQHPKKSQKVPVKNKTVEKSKCAKGCFDWNYSLSWRQKTWEKIDEKIWPKTFAHFLHNWDRGGVRQF